MLARSISIHSRSTRWMGAATLAWGASVYMGFGSLLLLLALQLGGALWLLKKQRYLFLVPILLVQFCYFGLGRLLTLIFFWPAKLSPVAHTEIFHLNVATILMIVAYVGLSRFLGKASAMALPSVRLEVTPLQLGLIAFIGSSILLLDFFPQEVRVLVMHIQVVALVSVYFLSSQRHSSVLLAVQLGCFFLGYFYFLRFVSLSFYFLLAAIWLVQWMLTRDGDFKYGLAAIVLLMIVLQAVKPDFRRSIHRQHEAGIWQRHHLVTSLAINKFKWLPDRSRLSREISYEGFKEHLASFVGVKKGRDLSSLKVSTLKFTDIILRISDNSLEKVMSQTPGRIPFQYGASYRGLWVTALPPFMESPLKWNEFGWVYGILGPNDHQTAVQFNHLAEGYMNFGVWGLLSAAVLFGLLLAFVEYYLSRLPEAWRPVGFVCFLLPFVLAYDTVSLLTNLTLNLFLFSLGVVVLPALSAVVGRQKARQPELGRSSR